MRSAATPAARRFRKPIPGISPEYMQNSVKVKVSGITIICRLVLVHYLSLKGIEQYLE